MPRISTTLTLEAAGFDRVLTQEEAKANGFAARMNRLGVGLLSGKSAAGSASAISEILSAQEKVTAFRKQTAYNEATTVGKIKMVTSDLRDLSVQRSKAEAGTAAAFGLQLQHEQKIAQLRSLQREQQSINVGGGLDEDGMPRGKGGLVGAFGKVLNKKFGPVALAKGILAGLAIGKLHDLTDGIAGAIMGGSIEGFEKLSEYADKEKELIQKRVDIYLTAGRRVEDIQKRIGKATTEYNSPRKSTTVQHRREFFGAGGGGSYSVTKYTESEQDYNLRKAKAKEELDTLELEKPIAEAALREHNRVIGELLRAPALLGETEMGKAGRLRAEATQDLLTGGNAKLPDAERQAAQRRGAQKLAEAAAAEYETARKFIAASEHIGDIERERLAITETGAQRVNRLREDAARLSQRSLDVSRSQADRDNDAGNAAVKRLQADQQELQNKIHQAALADHIREIEEGTASLGETTGERINRLRADALRLQERSRDMSRTEAQQEADRVQAAEKIAAAAALDYQWRNKPLTVEDAAARSPSGRHNTTAVGVMASRILDEEAKADRFRRMGNYEAAGRYGDAARAGREQFQQMDRAGRTAAQAAGGGTIQLQETNSLLKDIRDSVRTVDV